MKKLLSLGLALALCLGLAIPARAAGEDSGGDGEILDVIDCRFDGSETPAGLTLNAWDPRSSVLSTFDIDSCYTVKPGASFTVTYTGDDASGRLYVYVESYLKRTESAVYQADGADVDLKGQYLSTGAALLTGRSLTDQEGQSTPTANGLFWHQGPGWEGGEAIQLAKTLKPGESVTFSLPEHSGDAVYRLYAELYFPDSDDYFWETYDLRLSGSPVQPTPSEKPQPSESSTGFADVPAGIWYEEPVAWAVAGGITQGASDTAFAPDRTCTVAEVITFLWRAAGQPAPTISDPYTDGVSGQWYTSAALWAHESGLVGGDAFGASEPCLRSMVVSYLWKLNDAPAAAGASFTDVPASAAYAGAVAWAVEQGITKGAGDTAFNPSGTCTRAEIVTFLYRAFGA